MNYPELLRHIMENGKTVSPRSREVREVVKASLIVEPFKNIYAWPNARPYEKILGYLEKELAWYLSGDRSAAHIARFAGLWDKIKNPDGTLNSNYGYLVFYNRTKHPSIFSGSETMTPFEWAVSSLVKDQDSRQAVVTYNTGGFNFAGNDDYICTQHQAFLIRDNVLRCFVALRSSDAIFGLTFNMPWWSLVQQQLRLALLPYYPELKLGEIEVDIYSAHIYAHHYRLVEAMLAEPHETYNLEIYNKILISPRPWPVEWYQDHLYNFIRILP